MKLLLTLLFTCSMTFSVEESVKLKVDETFKRIDGNINYGLGSINGLPSLGNGAVEYALPKIFERLEKLKSAGGAQFELILFNAIQHDDFPVSKELYDKLVAMSDPEDKDQKACLMRIIERTPGFTGH
jgi:hypothetical protein